MTRPAADALPTSAAPMWWDGGDRAITAREKATIEEHGPSCFSIALVPATPSARWAADGLPDPHGARYACERAALTLGNLTDDELANAVYLHGNEQPSMADLMAGKALSGIAYLTAAKDRIRWLSRALAASCKQPLQVGQVQGDARAQFEAWAEAQSYRGGNIDTTRDSVVPEWYVSDVAAITWRAWQAALAARQPGAQVPVAHMVRWRAAGGWGLNMADEIQWFRDRADEYEIRDLVFADAAPHAQGIDLAPVRSALQAAEGLCACCAAIDGYSRNELHAFGLNMRQQFRDALALIKGRDATPGVANG